MHQPTSLFSTHSPKHWFVPNLYATIAYAENGLGCYLAYQHAKTTLNNKESETVNLIGSPANKCVYCQCANTAIVPVVFPVTLHWKMLHWSSRIKIKLSLLKQLNLQEYTFRPETMIVLNIEAYNWNCPCLSQIF
ncbi:MAG: hypothetical protein ABIN01_23710 [Ferruginibacter sp.]